MDNKPTKSQILALLRAFTAQRSGIEYGNYCRGPYDIEGHRAYFSEARSIQRDAREARTLLAFVDACEGITGPMLETALRGAFSGRLSLTAYRENSHVPAIAGEPCAWRLDYCTGQYFPTEYRRAVCAVCASAIWAHFRERMNAVPGGGFANAGGSIRRAARETFGRGIASRWFS